MLVSHTRNTTLPLFWGVHVLCCAGRMHDCEAKVLLTASGVMRGNKKIDLKAIADTGLDMCAKQGE